MSKKQRVTLADVARHLNLSRATVSNALNGNRYVSPKTRERVQQACEQLGYRANALAQSLRTNKTRIIGVTVPDILEPFLGLLVRHVERELRRFDYEMLLGSYFFDLAEERKVLHTFEDLRVDGVIAVSGTDENTPRYQDLAPETPVVFLERDTLGARISSVLADSHRVAYDAVTYFREHGHRKVAYLTIDYDNFRILRSRYRGYVDGLSANGLPFEDELLVKRSGILLHEIDYTLAEIRDLYDHLVRNNVTAVLVVSDYVAVALIKGLTTIGVRVPEQISILSVTNIVYGTVTTPTLSSFDLAPEFGAKRAVELIMKMQDRKRARTEHVQMPHLLIERESVLDRSASSRETESAVSRPSAR